jgi:hypothetical protein
MSRHCHRHEPRFPLLWALLVLGLLLVALPAWCAVLLLVVAVVALVTGVRRAWRRAATAAARGR